MLIALILRKDRSVCLLGRKKPCLHRTDSLTLTTLTTLTTLASAAAALGKKVNLQLAPA